MTTIERALDSDRPAIESLLSESGLPLDGLDVALPNAVVARLAAGDGAAGTPVGGIVGCAAVEPYGTVGLLRSVAVAPALRGTGLGRRLVAAVEALVAAQGIAELYLLTETAEGWFPRLGYRPTTRDAVPSPLTVSVEFTTACPEGAAVLHKLL
jgi:amino-acid N-acetyltransferase